MPTVQPRFARVAAAIGDPTRALMLARLLDGRHYTAKELAEQGGVAPATASQHLKLLVAGKVDFTTGSAAQMLVRHEQGLSDVAVALFGQRGDQAYVARADSGIKTLADLKGKRISVGAPKSGTELNARAVLKAAGLAYGDFAKVEYLPFGESVELMKNRQLDVTLQSAGLGVSSLRDLATSEKISVGPIPADVVKKVGDPAYQSAMIPAHTYEGQDQDVPTAAIQNFLVTRVGVSDDVVYRMAKAVFENHDALVAAHSAAKGITKENAVKSLPVPLHPGAAKYFKEIGVLK